MKPAIRFFCARWGHEKIPWKEFVQMVKEEGFSGVEIIALRFPEQKQDMLDALADSGLSYSLIQTEKKEGADFQKYLLSLHQSLREIAETYRTRKSQPEFIVSHTGREYYTMEQMAECFRVCDQVSRESGIPIIQETHRFRWSYAAHVVKDYLIRYPELRLALDLSHWFCVSESYLEDQEEALTLAIDRTVHVHARVGHTQGPQVTDPRIPENAAAMEAHLKYWDRWIDLLRRKGVPTCTITPEFGPYPYCIHSPANNLPIADLWEINCWMKNLLSSRYQ